MRNRIFILASIVIACGILSVAYAQMFDAKPTEKKIVPGINKIPPLLPVMSPNDFQSKVKSLSEDNRTAMTQKGLDTIQQQRDALPTVKLGEPAPLPPPKTPDATKNSSATPAIQTPATAQPAAPPAENTEQNTTDTEETEDNNTTEESVPSNASAVGNNASPPPKNTPSSSGGGLNIQY